MPAYFAKPHDGAAWITGASSGIGRAVALGLAREGFVVIATARNEEELVRLAGETSAFRGHVVAMPGDVTDADDMARIVDTIERQHGALALAILNAGIYLPVNGEALEVEDFRKTFAVNVAGVVNGLVPAVDAMKRAGRGQIAIVGSAAGYGGIPTGAAYSASKAALINMAESLKFDLDGLGIRIQIVNPGFVDTPLTRGSRYPMPALMSAEDAARRLIEGLKMNRFEVAFPRRFTILVRTLRLLPYGVYFRVLGHAPSHSGQRLSDEADKLAAGRARAR